MNRKRILIVDDDPVVLKALSMRLSGAGYDVLLADDGAAAVSVVRQNRPDLILLDISFPPDVFAGSVAWDGFLILEWLRRIDEAKNTPVTMISHTISAEIVEIAERARAAGAIEFFAKPVDTNRLIELVGRLLDPATLLHRGMWMSTGQASSWWEDCWTLRPSRRPLGLPESLALRFKMPCLKSRHPSPHTYGALKSALCHENCFMNAKYWLLKKTK